jgi:tetratricopeptide (TPR) repeat protein
MSRAGIAGSLVLLAGFVAVGAVFVRPMGTGAFIGFFGYAFYRAVIARRIVCRHHHRGVQRFRLGRFEAAYTAFARSEAFFARHRWLDRGRSVLLGTAVAYDFTALARYNQAQCLGRMGQTEEAVRFLDALLADHPDMAPAIALRGALTSAATRAPTETDPDKWFDGDVA